MVENPNRYQDRGKFLAIAIVIAVAMFFIYMMTFKMDTGPTPEPDMGQRGGEVSGEAAIPPALPGTGEPDPADRDDIPFQKRQPEVIVPENGAFPPGEETGEGETGEESGGLYIPPAWIANAVPVAAPAGKNRVAIIIDDLGENRTGSRAVIELPGPLTLAFLPYPDKVAEMAAQGREAGHEIMVHMPMEAMDPGADIQPYVLRANMERQAFSDVFSKNLAAFDGYVGINNHMGSRLTQDPDAMSFVMTQLADKGLLFVDSRTIHTSVAAETARTHGIPYAERDVFLDHEPTKEGVAAALAELERVAATQGFAVAIGHPKTETIEALRAWLPTLAEKNLVLVPVSVLVRTEASAMTPDAAAAVPVR